MSYRIPRCRVLPLPDHQVSFEIDRQERLRWHFGPQYSRPFIYPFYGPSRISLTRMGHPGTVSHDHHRSIWFAHPKVMGMNFWSENNDQGTYCRQQAWLAYEDRDDEARMAVQIGWFDGHDAAPLIEQDLVLAVRTTSAEETVLELQTTFRPVAETLELGESTLGPLGIRVSAELSEYFGGGQLTNTHGDQGETNIFGKPANWVDYSGPVQNDEQEGITCFYHPENINAPVGWHVREDGWMSASVCGKSPLLLKRSMPTTLRYLLWAHAGTVDKNNADTLFEQFAQTKPYVVKPASTRHREFEIHRSKNSSTDV
ncbi:MAG: PmoA family protein [Planctomycetaceae bacterium]|nr:PmoA family protein [Planctomycetaceae bacterium]